jgi:two-component system chemotaxis response regulator CheY
MSEQQQYNFLIVDDSSAIRAILRRALRDTGLHVNWENGADNGHEALDVLEKAQKIGKRYDAIFTDINMPAMNGIELLKALKTDAYFRDIPVIIIEIGVDENKRAMLREFGAAGFICKPFNPEAIRVEVERILAVAPTRNILQQNQLQPAPGGAQ